MDPDHVTVNDVYSRCIAGVTVTMRLEGLRSGSARSIWRRYLKRSSYWLTNRSRLARRDWSLVVWWRTCTT